MILPDGAVTKYNYNNQEFLEKITDEYGNEAEKVLKATEKI